MWCDHKLLLRVHGEAIIAIAGETQENMVKTLCFLFYNLDNVSEPTFFDNLWKLAPFYYACKTSSLTQKNLAFGYFQPMWSSLEDNSTLATLIFQ